MSQAKVLGGRYLLQDKIGAGGMATVYRAHDQVLDRTVAIKIMLPQYANDPTFAARFKQEAQAAAALSSPYIVSVYDWGKDEDTYFIAMEYLRGTDLKTGIRSHGALDPKKVAQIASQICGALSVAHKHEIIHRDIKPQNIMVLADGSIKVMDFGIARAKNSHLTQDNNVLGTAHYVSPEQTRGQELGPTSDLYSLGVVMYECATGKVPFDGDDAISVALKQVNELPVPPSQLNPAVDATLERIILKLMEKDPAKRFQTADELRQVLNSYVAGRTVAISEPTTVLAAGAGATSATTSKLKPGSTASMARPNAQTVPAAAQTMSATNSYTPEKKGGKGKVVAIVAAILIIVAAAAFAATSMLGGEQGTTVPSVLGMTEEKARETLEEAGYELGEVGQDYSNEYGEGQVCDQSPDEGRALAEGGTVDIWISQGEDPAADDVQVPSGLVGKSESEVQEALMAAGLEPKKGGEEASDDVDKGDVVSVDPGEGETVNEGDVVTYIVSSGPDTESVPDIKGDSTDEATSRLDERGFGMYIESYDYSDDVPEDCIISYNPSGKQEPGTTINVVVSLGPDPAQQEPSSDSNHGDNNDADGSDDTEEEPSSDNNHGGNNDADFDPSTLDGVWETEISDLVPNGYDVNVSYVEDDSVPVGQVISASLSGATVNVVVSGTGTSDSSE